MALLHSKLDKTNKQLMTGNAKGLSLQNSSSLLYSLLWLALLDSRPRGTPRQKLTACLLRDFRFAGEISKNLAFKSLAG
jgi:hypothetical protein